MKIIFEKKNSDLEEITIMFKERPFRFKRGVEKDVPEVVAKQFLADEPDKFTAPA